MFVAIWHVSGEDPFGGSAWRALASVAWLVCQFPSEHKSAGGACSVPVLATAVARYFLSGKQWQALSSQQLDPLL